MPYPSDTNPRPLPWRLRAFGSVSGQTDNQVEHEAQFSWPTSDPDEIVQVTIECSLNEYVGLASSIDVGRDIAYNDDSINIWWLWTRRILFTPPAAPTRYKYRATPFDWGYTGDGGYFINVREDCMTPIYVNFYEGCCGDDVKGGKNADLVSAGAMLGDGNVSSDIGNYPTKCDVATYLVPYFISQAREWLVAVDAAVGLGTDLVDAIVGTSTNVIDFTGVTPAIIEDTADFLAQFLDPMIEILLDTDFVRRVQINWWGRVPQEPQFTNFVRSDALNLGQSFPLAWGNLANGTLSSPRLLGEIFGRVADVQKLSLELAVSIGKADNALCQVLASQYGEDYTFPVEPIAPQTVPIYEETIGTNKYTVYQMFDEFVSQRVPAEGDVALPAPFDFEAGTIISASYGPVTKLSNGTTPGGVLSLRYSVQPFSNQSIGYTTGNDGGIGVTLSGYSRPNSLASETDQVFTNAGIDAVNADTVNDQNEIVTTANDFQGVSELASSSGSTEQFSVSCWVMTREVV